MFILFNSNTTSATSTAWIIYLEHTSTAWITYVEHTSSCSIFSFLCSVFVYHCLSPCPFSFHHCNCLFLSLQIRITPWIPANFFLYDVPFTSSCCFNAYQCLNGNSQILEKKKSFYNSADFAFIYNFFDISNLYFCSSYTNRDSFYHSIYFCSHR